MRYGSALLATAALMLWGCGGDDASPPPITSPSPPPAPAPTPTPSPTPTPTPTPTPVTGTLDFTFAQDEDGFIPEISEYSPDTEFSTFEFRAEIDAVPNIGGNGYRIQSINRSDDVFMFLWKPVTGLTPNQRYRVDSTVRFAANVPLGCFGIGGSPSGVVIQAGASPVEPMLVVSTDPGDAGNLVPNFEHGVQNTEDGSPFTLGVIGQNIPGARCDGSGPYQVKELATDPDNAPVLTTDSEGRLWAFMGTDSPFEGLTVIYWLSGSFAFTPVQ